MYPLQIINMSCISDLHFNEHLKITNPKIVSFYKSNPHINIELVNLSLMDILNSTQNATTSSNLESCISEIKMEHQESQKIKELESFIIKVHESMQNLINNVSNNYINAKNEYTRDFKSASSETNCVELFEKINNTFFENTRSLFAVVISIRFSNMSEKTKVILNQFNKILTANTSQILSISFASDPSSTYACKIEDYLTVFESNSTHMMQAITKLLSDCIIELESRTKKTVDLIKKKEDNSFVIYYKLIYELNDLTHQLQKIKDDQTHSPSFEHILSQQFPTASILHELNETTNEYLLSRQLESSATSESVIYIETHCHREQNVSISDVKRFLKRVAEKRSNAILVSQYTGITSKPNYHIEIHNNIVVVYLHKLAFSTENIRIATDMIDSISVKLTDFCTNSENKYSVPKDVLDGINREYQQFILQKEMIISGFKEQQKNLLAKLDDMRFSVLDKYLSTRYSSCKKQGYNCELCNNFNVETLKGLAAHKRGCARKMQKTPDFIEPEKHFL